CLDRAALAARGRPWVPADDIGRVLRDGRRGHCSAGLRCGRLSAAPDDPRLSGTLSMNGEKWDKAGEVFARALEVEPELREAFVAEAGTVTSADTLGDARATRVAGAAGTKLSNVARFGRRVERVGPYRVLGAL